MNPSSFRKSVITMVTSFTALFVAFMSGRSYPLEQPSVAATCPAEPDDAWVFRRIDTCNRACGATLPFEVDATKDTIRCTCARPELIRRLAVGLNERLARAPVKEE